MRLSARLDWGLLIPVGILLVFSLTALILLNPSLFRNQLLFAGVSFVIFFFLLHVQYSTLKEAGVFLYGLSLLGLVVVLLLGFESRGAVRWLGFFGLSVQFSEILKPLFAISLASYLSQRDTSLKTLIQSIGLLIPIIFFIYLQPDLGNAIIFLCATLLTLFLFGFSLRSFVVLLVMSIIFLPVGWQLLHGYQRQRIITYLHPTHDPLGSSYNAVQSVIAVGSGEVFGKGLSQGTQSGLRFLPERHTDFMFATLSEELGFLGILILLISFTVLFYRIYCIVSDSKDVFSKLFATFAFSILLIQCFVNIGMNIGLLPVVGVTLPFVSYGGSSIVANFMLLGILSSMSNASSNRSVLEIQ